MPPARVIYSACNGIVAGLCSLFRSVRAVRPGMHVVLPPRGWKVHASVRGAVQASAL